ncbi:unnamed protein product [Eruca vesicaria subsp. sativa]|uniref:Uncharacterized protein n=1 Tax=Eruca vesicaria subsp. sativa TaxID=29727 RepID=A0ABC8KSJ4_ERUVS|nr:unnamed protein product [Eruca vesicaria subsp. sativa]
MASDSQTATATTSEKPMENKVNEEASLMEKKIVLVETVDVVKDKPVSDSNLTVDKEEEIDQTPAGEPEKELPAEVDEAAAVVKADESTDNEKVAEQVELKEPTLVKESVAEVIVQAVDEEKPEGKGKDENDEEKVAEEVELKEPTLVKESVDEVVVAEKAEEKLAVESVAEEDNKDKLEEKMVDVSESTDEVGGKQVEPVDVPLSGEVSAETVDVEVLEVVAKPETSEEVEAQPEKAKELAPEVEVVKTPETTEQAKVELEGKLDDSIVETKDSSINSKDEQTSESGSALCPKETVPISQDSDTSPKKEPEGDTCSLPDVTEKTITEENHFVNEPSKDEKASESVSATCPERVVATNHVSDTNPEKEAQGNVSSPSDVIEKAITEEKQVVEEPSKEKVSEEAKDVVTNLATEDENITKDTETPTAEGKSQETLKETDTKSITEKVAEVVETATVAKEIDEEKQEPEVTTKEVKHSRSIMSKVKQSLVKAKKAIIGKSPSSKTISTEETKEEIKAK